MALDYIRCVRGVVLAGAHPWDEPSGSDPLLRPMVPVAHQPLIGYVVNWLKAGGVHKGTICANGASRFVRGYLGDGSHHGMELDYYEDLIPRGPAGCALDSAQRCDAEHFVVADGTIIPQVDLERLLTAHRDSDAAVTVVVNRENAVDSHGERWVPTGIYVFHRRVFAYVQGAGYQDVKEVLIPKLHASGERVLTYCSEGVCPRVTDASTYLAVNGWWIERLVREKAASSEYVELGESLVHRTACVSPSARLIGPVLIGADTVVEDRVTVVGPTSLGAGCCLAEGSVVCRSVMWDSCHVGRASMVDRCILRNEAVVADESGVHSTMICSRKDRTHSRMSTIRKVWGSLRRRHQSERSSVGVDETLTDGWNRQNARKLAQESAQQRIRREERPGCPTRLINHVHPVPGDLAP